jgi:hypothetical protein
MNPQPSLSSLPPNYSTPQPSTSTALPTPDHAPLPSSTEVKNRSSEIDFCYCETAFEKAELEFKCQIVELERKAQKASLEFKSEKAELELRAQKAELELKRLKVELELKRLKVEPALKHSNSAPKQPKTWEWWEEVKPVAKWMLIISWFLISSLTLIMVVAVLSRWIFIFFGRFLI